MKMTNCMNNINIILISIILVVLICVALNIGIAIIISGLAYGGLTFLNTSKFSNGGYFKSV